MEAKYAIIELENGWVLSSDAGDVYYNTIGEVLRVINSEEGGSVFERTDK